MSTTSNEVMEDDDETPTQPMKLSAFIALLQARLARNGDVDVKYTWEGIFKDIYPEGVYLAKDGLLDAPTLLLEADESAFYFDDFANPDQDKRHG